MITLYDYYRSSASYRVRIALNLKQLTYHVVPIHLTKNGGEQHALSYLDLNPQGLVPTLVDETHVLTQSLAIIEYLEEKYPTPHLLPKNSADKAWVRAIGLAIAADLHPLNNLRVLTFLEKNAAMTTEKKMAWYHHWIIQEFSALQLKLTKSALTGKCCYGDEPSLADICLIPQIYNAKRFNVDLSPYPTLMRIDAHCKTLPAFIHAYPHDSST